jgi:hypothetical protein
MCGWQQFDSACDGLGNGDVPDAFRERCYLWHHRWSSHDFDTGSFVPVRMLELWSELERWSELPMMLMLPFVVLPRVDLPRVVVASGMLLKKPGDR